ncbi:WIYLD domain [Arabidopsis suecica]|uniref:WIYLD domain n=1 Tax=Arabidopsis suecica TaxID=45249 RepID=A0A8T2H9V8_ARASU|nr:WIYLD domain [Arabidopsis suecica]
MAPKGRDKIGLRCEDAARDRMKEFGFKKPVINASIKHVLKVYGEDQWFLIEDANYDALLNICLEKQEEQANIGGRGTRRNSSGRRRRKAVMDSSPSAFQFVEAPPLDYAHHSVGGAQSSHCGWLSSEDETDPDEDSDGDDDEMIQLTPEPLCEELEELLREVYMDRRR